MKRIFFFSFCLLVKLNVLGQASFTTPDTVCVNDPVAITNTSVGASTYYWNFCGYDLYGTPTLTDLGNPGNLLNVPTFNTIQEDNGIWYGFVSNFGRNSLIRMTYGNSLLNTPTVEDLGTLNGVVPEYTEGLQVVKDGNGWHLLVVGGHTTSLARMIKVDFGNSLGTPKANLTTTNWGNINNTLNFPHELAIIQEGSDYWGLTVNADDNTVTRFFFGKDFTNPPTAENLGNVTGTLNWPNGIYAAKYNGKNYVFISNSYKGTQKGTLVRMDFGSSIGNTPVSTDLGNANGALGEPRDVVIINDCGNFYGLVVNNISHDIARIDFPAGLDGTIVGTKLTVQGLSFPVSLSSMFRDGDNLYSMITDADTYKMFRLEFNSCTNSSTPSSTSATPPTTIKYDLAGVYSIHLLTDESLSTQSSFCKEVVVLARPKPYLGKDTGTCGTGPLTLDAGPGRTYKWNTGETTKTIIASHTGDYIVTVSNGYCEASDTIHVTVNKPLSLTNTVVTNIDCGVEMGQIEVMPTGGLYPYSYYFNGFGMGKDSLYPKLDPGSYLVKVVDAMGCEIGQSFTVVENTANIIRATASGTNPTCYDANDGSITIQVNKGVPPFEYTIDTFKTSQTLPVIKGLVQGNYHIYIRNAVCIDSVSIELPAPAPLKTGVSITNDLCERGNGAVEVNPSGSTSPYKFYWGSDLMTKTRITNLSAGTYSILIRDAQNCRLDSIVTIGNKNVDPIHIWNNDTTINIGQSVTLNAANGIDYIWTPDKSLSCVDCASPRATPDSTTTYIVNTVTGLNCIPSDTVTVTVTHFKKLFIPTAFTPNGDGQNDVFRVKGLGIAYFNMRIYNRVGNLLFETSDYSSGWDGKLRDEVAPLGTYVYVIEYGFYGDEMHPQLEKGTVTLVR